MTECFTPDGHLTDEALTMLIHGELDELSRLEVGEHLSFCDACLERYTALLTEDVLETPAIEAVRPVMGKLRSRRRNELFRRCASAAAAVAVTAALWYGGVFDTMGRAIAVSAEPQAYSQTEPKPPLSYTIVQTVDTWCSRILETAQSAFSEADLWK